MPPFDVFALCTVKVLELALRKNLSNEKLLAEMRKIREFEKELTKIFEER
jgi:hypothetical protein